MDEARQLIETCRQKSIELLRANLTPSGILAATPTERAEERRYTRIFGRDASMCAIAMALSRDPELQAGARASLCTLAEHQAANGQIPKYVDPIASTADFWYLGCIDSSLWWLIALKLSERSLREPSIVQQWQYQVAKALDWLQCQEHQQLHLLQQNEASDWADIMPRSGFVLYTNALWYYVKRLYGLPRQKETCYHFNYLFFPFVSHLPDYRRLRLLAHYVRNKAKNRTLYLSYVNLASWGEEGDVFGNALAILCGLADSVRTRCVLDAIHDAQQGAPYPTRAICTPIGRDDPSWRAYMGRHRQNLEHQYHNGGIWPFIGGFWVMALAAAGRKDEARAELARLARANAANDWEFNEWFHGQSGEPMGMPGQSWNAALFLLACRALEAPVF